MLKVGDRVKIKVDGYNYFGWREGTIESIGGSNIYDYDVLVDGHKTVMGFNRHELEPIAPVDSAPVFSQEDKKVIDKVLTDKLRSLHAETKKMGLPEEKEDFQCLVSEMVAILGVLNRLGD